MANPLIFWNNLLDVGEFSGNNLAITSEASGFPKEHLYDWRMSTASRWKATSTADQHIDLDFGAGSPARTEADTLAIAGHNLGTVGAQVTVYGDTATDPPTTVRLASFTPTNDLPIIKTFTKVDMRYWRVTLDNTPSAAVQIGIVCLGRRLDFEAGALAELDPYNRSATSELFVNNKGMPIGVNIHHKAKRFSINYGSGDPGMTRDSFFAPSSGIGFDSDSDTEATTFLDHAVDNAKPFFFNWNIDVDADENYLCRVDGTEVSMPFVSSTARRGLICSFIAHREVA